MDTLPSFTKRAVMMPLSGTAKLPQPRVARALTKRARRTSRPFWGAPFSAQTAFAFQYLRYSAAVAVGAVLIQ